jgi:hypothetical protein
MVRRPACVSMAIIGVVTAAIVAVHRPNSFFVADNGVEHSRQSLNLVRLIGHNPDFRF